ncbi:MAG: acyl-CoA dehydrogenase family protein, partial [Planctomycetales bacterium]|nr:acyl-CoA dehydrogenase family protein [Planctomycetales bacterium]
GTFPTHLIPEMAEMGVFGASLKGYGCAGVSNVAYGLIMQELERGDSGVRSCASVQGGLVMYPIYAFGSDAQKEKWLPKLQQGKAIGCFGLTEPDFGSNPAGMRTRAEKVPGGYVLHGTKMWITNGHVADVAVVWARLDDVIRGFLVEKGTPGFSTRDVPPKFSLRASVTSELTFDKCKVPEDALLPGSKGLGSPLKCLMQARYGIAWGAVGAAMACFDEALRYSQSRIQFDRPIAGFQLVQKKFADMLTAITNGQLLAYRLGRLKDEDQLTTQQVSLAKRHNVRMALECARTCRDILGASGITYEYQCGRHMCNLESVFTYEGTDDIHALILGEAVTGIAAYK